MPTPELLPYPLSLAEARRDHVCRLCGRPDKDGPMPFILDFGHEFSHESCLEAAGIDWKAAQRTRERRVEVARRTGPDGIAELVGIAETLDSLDWSTGYIPDGDVPKMWEALEAARNFVRKHYEKTGEDETKTK